MQCHGSYANENEKKLKLLADDAKDYAIFKEKVFKIYKDEFEDALVSILLVKEPEFMHSYYTKMNLIIEDLYSHEAYEIERFADLIKETEDRILEECYRKSVFVLSKGWLHYERLIQENSRKSRKSFNESVTSGKKISLKRDNTSLNNIFLKVFLKHCNMNDSPLHTCEGRLLPIYDKNNLSYVICVNCKSSYYAHSILMYCSACKKEFYSTASLSNTDKDYQPATWEKYHCGAIINDQMKCIKCKDKFFLRLQNGKLFCKKCKFESEPLAILWECLLCGKDFKSNAKIYNPMEFKLVKNAIKNALLFKNSIKPSYLPCCFEDPNNLEFIHRADCGGTVYSGELSGQEIIVCSICKSLSQRDKFLWTCPLCQTKFKEDFQEKQRTSNAEDLCHWIKDIRRDELLNQRAGDGTTINSSIKKTKEIYFGNSTNKENDTIGGEKQSQSELSKDLVIHKRCTLSNICTVKSDNMRTSKSNIAANISERNYNSAVKPTRTYEIKKPGRDLSVDSQMQLNNPNSSRRLNFFSNISRPLSSDKLFEKEEIRSRSRTPILGYDKPTEIINKAIEDESLILESFVGENNDNIPAEVAETVIPKVKNDNAQIQLKEFTVEQFNTIAQFGESAFGKIFIIEDKKKNFFAMKKIIVNDDIIFYNFIKEYELVNRLSHANIIKILGLCKRKLSVKAYALYIMMEMGISDWEREINERFEVQQYYTEKELMGILRQLVSGLAFLQKKSISHSDIRPHNIIIFQNSVFKLGDYGESKQLPTKKTPNTLPGQELFMSPLLFSALKTKQNTLVHDPYKSDVFSLGLSFLYAATLSSSILLEFRNILESQSVSLFLHKTLSSRYSVRLINVLGKMMEINERKRYNFLELENILKEA